jgi:hypothetical protein
MQSRNRSTWSFVVGRRTEKGILGAKQWAFASAPFDEVPAEESGMESCWRGAATLLDGRHNLQLAEAQVTTLVLSQGRPVIAEDIRNLQGWHERALLGSGRFQRTEHFAQGLGSHVGIQRRGLELLVSE